MLFAALPVLLYNYTLHAYSKCVPKFSYLHILTDLDSITWVTTARDSVNGVLTHYYSLALLHKPIIQSIYVISSDLVLVKFQLSKLGYKISVLFSTYPH